MESAGDESVWEAEFGAEVGFARGHLARVGLVVEACEVEEAVEEEDAEFGLKRVTEAGGLSSGGFEGDGEVAGVLVGGGKAGLGRGGEAENVGGHVFSAIGAIETLQLGIGGEQDVHGADKTDGGAGAVEEAGEGGLRWEGLEGPAQEILAQAGRVHGDHLRGYFEGILGSEGAGPSRV